MFLEGIGFGLCVGLGFMFWSGYSYQNILILKSKKEYRTPEKLRDEFYYIVPSEEYLEMEQALLFRKMDEYSRKEK